MQLMIRGRWRSGALDACLGSDQRRLQVFAWIVIVDHPCAQVQTPQTLRHVARYALAVGARATARKVVSRARGLAQEGRVGALILGRVLAPSPDASSDERSDERSGVWMWAWAPWQVMGASRVVCEACWCAPASPAHLRAVLGDPIPDVSQVITPGGLRERWPLRWLDARRLDPAALAPAALRPLLHRHPWSGQPAPTPQQRDALLDPLIRWATLAPWASAHARQLSCGPPRERRAVKTPADPQGDARPSMILFGCGHYARTCVLPHVQAHLRLETIHELDSPGILAWMDAPGAPRVTWDTSPWLRPDERADVVWIAGYHHTHAPLAVEAMRRGACAVVEKPAVTTRADLDALLEAVRAGGRLWTGYHKRDEPPTRWIRQDLGLQGRHTPCDYHAIVHEPALPPGHWYRWPSSRSRVLSNACHWIDHFLTLNGDASPQAWRVERLGQDGLLIIVWLDQGATLTLSLSSQGSQRLGVRELVEVRRAGRTARLIDGSSYLAESTSRVLRRARWTRQSGYALMIARIARQLRGGLPGETPQALERLNGLLLALDAQAMDDGLHHGPYEGSHEGDPL